MPSPPRFRNRRRAGAASHGLASASTPGAAGSASPARKAKYNAQGRHVDGVWCASEAEAVRFEQLQDMRAIGLVSQLETQPSYIITINNTKICTYRADFRYRWHGPEVIDARGIEVVEEVKGLETPEWKLKCKLVEASYGFTINMILKLCGKDWDDRPKLSALMVGKKSSFAEQIKVRYAGRIADLPEDLID